MATWHSREHLVHQVVTFAGQKMSRRAIAHSVGVSRNTVKKILDAHDKQRRSEHIALPPPPKRAPRPTKLDPYKGRVSELFEKYHDITIQRIFEILRNEGFEGSYTTVKKHVRFPQCARWRSPADTVRCTRSLQ